MPDTTGVTLRGIVQDETEPDAMVYTDEPRARDGPLAFPQE